MCVCTCVCLRVRMKHSKKRKKGRKTEKGKIERERVCPRGKKKVKRETWNESEGKTICYINLPLHSASTESFLHSSFSREDPGDGNAKPHSILPPETLISY